MQISLPTQFGYAVAFENTTVSSISSKLKFGQTDDDAVLAALKQAGINGNTLKK